MADVNKEIAIKVTATDASGPALESLEDKLNAAKKRMIELAVAGKQNTEEFRNLQKEAGSYKRTIEGVEQSVDSFAKGGTRALTLVVEASQALAAGFAIAQGAAALFGDENEDLQKAMVQVQGAIALVNGVQQISILLTQKSVITTEAAAAAQKLYAIAIGTSTGAMKAFRIALLATGIGAAVAAVGLLIAKWDELTAAVRRFLNLPDPAIAAKAREMALLREEAALSNYRDAYEAHTNAQIKADEERDRKQKEATQKRLERLKAENDAIIKFVADLNLQLYEMELDRQAQEEKDQEKTMQAGAARRVRDAKVAVDIAKLRAENEIKIQEEVTKSNIDISKAGFQSLGELATAFANQSEASQKKAFQVNKAAGIAQAIIDTYAAAQGAYKSQLSVPDVTAPIRAKIAAGIAIAAGLARVAAISKTQFRTTSSGVPSAIPSGGGGPETAPPPIFANPQMTMLGTDGAAMGQGQGTQPMRAYVVERDITQSTRRVRRLEEFATLGA
jgi:hypothetical protein